MTTGEVRAAMVARLRAAGPGYWLLVFAVTTATNLLDFASVPNPGERPGAGFVGAAIVRVLLVFWAGYAVARRLAGMPRPLVPTGAAARFFLFSFVFMCLYGAAAFGWDHALALRERPLATQWLAMLGFAAIWGVGLIRLIGIGPALAGNVPFGGVAKTVRETRGSAGALALGYVQIVLPFAAIHLALTLVGVRLSLATEAVAALALIDGIVSGVQLMLVTALGVVAWRGPALRDRRAGG